MNRITGKSGRIAAALLCAVAILSIAGVASAADIATLKNGFTIRHDHRIVIGDMTRLFTSADDSSFTDVATADITGFEQDLTPPPPQPAAAPSFPATGPARATAAAPAPVDLNKVVTSASAEYKLDPDLLNSVIHAESGFNVRARSPKGAQGLMQLMPSTANALGVNNAYDPAQNVDGGSKYLRELLERYNFDLVKALAAYNAGPQRVEQYHGVPPFRETRAYVARIIKEYNRKIDAQEKAEALAKKQSAPAKKPSAAPTAHSTPATHSPATKAAHSQPATSSSDSKRQSAKLAAHPATSAAPLTSPPASDGSPR
ncbi:MAG: transglycosylase SLT domain-containing protein [Terriglobales bacterium]